MWIHTKMFTIDDWVLILLGCLLISLMLSCFNDQEESKPPTCGRVFKMKDSLAMATQHMVGLGDLDLPIQSWLGSKITLLTSSICGLTMFTLYCSLLTSKATISISVPTIKDFEDAHRQGYQMMFWKNSLAVQQFKLSEPGSIGRDIYQTLVDNPWAQFTSMEDMLANLRAKDKKTLVYARDTVTNFGEDLVPVHGFQHTHWHAHDEEQALAHHGI